VPSLASSLSHKCGIVARCYAPLYDAVLAHVVTTDLPEAEEQFRTGQTFGMNEWLEEGD
jgi:hypothetical protein